MVCSKCQKRLKSTSLATPAVKRKGDPVHGAGGNNKNSPSTLGNTGVSKSKLLGQNAKIQHALYSSSCKTCKTKTEQGRTDCQSCAFKANACAVCGKTQQKAESKNGQPIVQGQKFSSK